jgi:hypothetical protein
MQIGFLRALIGLRSSQEYTMDLWYRPLTVADTGSVLRVAFERLSSL